MKYRVFALCLCASALTTPKIPADDGIYTIEAHTYVDVPIDCHIVAEINFEDRYLQLEDESRWKIPEKDLYNLSFWGAGQFVTIVPNGRWFSDYDYSMINRVSGDRVSANLLRGPLHTSPYTHHISGMDQNHHGKKVIILDEKTCWSISGDYYHVVDGWNVNDTVIIGTNDAWFTPYNMMLINVEMNTSAKARRM